MKHDRELHSLMSVIAEHLDEEPVLEGTDDMGASVSLHDDLTMTIHVGGRIYVGTLTEVVL